MDDKVIFVDFFHTVGPKKKKKIEAGLKSGVVLNKIAHFLSKFELFFFFYKLDDENLGNNLGRRGLSSEFSNPGCLTTNVFRSSFVLKLIAHTTTTRAWYVRQLCHAESFSHYWLLISGEADSSLPWQPNIHVIYDIKKKVILCIIITA